MKKAKDIITDLLSTLVAFLVLITMVAFFVLIIIGITYLVTLIITSLLAWRC